MKQNPRFTAVTLALLTAVLATSSVATQSPATDWNVGDVFVGVGLFDANPGKYLVYSPQGVLKEQVVDASAATIKSGGAPAGITTGCMVGPSDNGYADALYTTTFYTNRVMRFESAHPHAASLAATPTHPNLEAIESIVFDNLGNYYVSGLPPARDSAAEDAPAEAFIFKYRRINGVDHLQATYTVPNGPIGQRGVDWLDVGSDQQTLFWTSEGTRVHEYRPSTNAYRSIQIRYPDGLPVQGTAYAMRALPPTPGDPLLRPSGFLVAMHSQVLRIAYDGPENDNSPEDMDGVIVHAYAGPVGGEFFALNITPDGQSFWTATYQKGPAAAGHLYKFHIASGALTRGPIPVQDMAGTRINSVWGLCVKREYTAAVNACFETDGAGTVVLENGAPKSIVCKVPEVCDKTGVDNDGDGQEALDLTGPLGVPDGQPDGFDDDCRNPTVPVLATADKVSAEGEAVGPASPVNTTDPIAIQIPDGRPLTIEITDLPAFFAVDGFTSTAPGVWTRTSAGTSMSLVFTGTPPIGTVAANPSASFPGYPVRVRVREGENILVQDTLQWRIIRRNAPLTASDPSDRVCAVALACDTHFTVNLSDADNDAARFTTVTLPPGFTQTVLGGENADRLAPGVPFEIQGPASFPSTGDYSFRVCAVDIPGTVAEPLYEPSCVEWTLRVTNDNTPPVLTLPPSVTIEATSPAGAPHTFVVSATDNIDGPVPVTCSATSGATFALGTTTVNCSATDSLNNTASGSFTITVVDTTAPAGACTPSFNPSTKHIPNASGINEDGFYLVGGSDAVSGPVSIKIGSYTLQNGETVKFTQSNGLNGVVFGNYQQTIRHFRVGPSDPVVTITDAAGNTTSVTCYVPSKPK